MDALVTKKLEEGNFRAFVTSRASLLQLIVSRLCLISLTIFSCLLYEKFTTVWNSSAVLFISLLIDLLFKLLANSNARTGFPAFCVGDAKRGKSVRALLLANKTLRLHLSNYFQPFLSALIGWFDCQCLP